MQTPEHKEKQRVKLYLDKLGAYHFWAVVTGWGRPTLDCLVCIDGVFWGIEVKCPGGKLTERQKITIRQIEEAGGQVVWGTADEIIEFIRNKLPVLRPEDPYKRPPTGAHPKPYAVP